MPSAVGREPAEAMAALFAAADRRVRRGRVGLARRQGGSSPERSLPLTRRLRWALARAFLGGPGLPATVTVDGAPFSLFGVPGPSSRRLHLLVRGTGLGDHAVMG